MNYSKKRLMPLVGQTRDEAIDWLMSQFIEIVPNWRVTGVYEMGTPRTASQWPPMVVMARFKNGVISDILGLGDDVTFEENTCPK